MSPVEAELRAAAEFLRPDLRDEILRLYAAVDALAIDNRELADRALVLTNQHHSATVLSGALRDQVAGLQHRLEDLKPDQHALARRDALFLGTGYLRIERRSRDHYQVERISPARVVLRDDD